MSKTLTISLLACIALYSCNGNGGQSSESEGEATDSFVATPIDTLHLLEVTAPPVTVDELFDDFFFNFTSDQKFQNQRVTLPLPFDNKGDKSKINKETWSHYNHFKAQEFYSVIYEREQDLELQKDTSINEVTVEWTYLSEKLIEQFIFRRISGKWMLTSLKRHNFQGSANSSFLHFLSEFVSDSCYQRESIEEPLKFVIPAEDSEEDSETEELSVDEWFEMQSDMPVLTNTIVNINYGQTCISQNRKTLLVQGVGNGLCMKFKFNNINGQWKLIEIEN